MDKKKYREAFDNNIPEGYNGKTFIIECPVCHREFQTTQGNPICPECGAKLEFSVEEK